MILKIWSFAEYGNYALLAGKYKSNISYQHYKPQVINDYLFISQFLAHTKNYGSIFAVNNYKTVDR